MSYRVCSPAVRKQRTSVGLPVVVVLGVDDQMVVVFVLLFYCCCIVVVVVGVWDFVVGKFFTKNVTTQRLTRMTTVCTVVVSFSLAGEYLFDE